MQKISQKEKGAPLIEHVSEIIRRVVLDFKKEVDLDHFLELESKATPGPWKWHDDSDYYETLCGPFKDAREEEFKLSSENFVMDDGSACGEYSRNLGSDTPDGQLIVAMRNNFRNILLELKAARERK